MKTNIVLVLATGIIMLIVAISMEKRVDDLESFQESSLQMKRLEVIAVGALLLASAIQGIGSHIYITSKYLPYISRMDYHMKDFYKQMILTEAINIISMFGQVIIGLIMILEKIPRFSINNATNGFAGSFTVKPEPHKEGQ
jgi:hypothetical protein